MAAPSALVAQATSASSKPVVEQIYDKLHELFLGSDQQIFCMEFPGRVLDMASYSYPVDSVYAALVRPQPVVEAEFRLADAMFDVAQIVGGPNGGSVAETYRRVLDLYLPKATSSAFDHDQDHIRIWLVETVPGEYDENNIPLSRIALFKKLSSEYLSAREGWKRRRTDLLNNAWTADDPETELELVARTIAVEGPAIEAKLAALYDDLVVRGNLHKVQAALGYLDIQLEAGVLESAKDSLRNAEMLALDESRSIYPVQFQPADWFMGLRTDFQPQDLLMDPGVVRDRILQKQKELNELETQRGLLLAGEQGDASELRAKVQTAQTQLDAAQAEQIKNFSEATLTIAEWAVNKYYTGDIHAKEVKANEKGSRRAQSAELEKPGVLNDINDQVAKKKAGPPLSAEDWKKLREFQDKAIDAQTELTQSSRRLTDAMLRAAAAEGSDAQKALVLIEGKMQRLRQEMAALEEAQSKVSDLVETVEIDDPANPGAKITVNRLTEAPSPHPGTSPAAGRWMDVIVESQSSNAESSTTLSTHASQTSWQVDAIFGSAGGSESTQRSNYAFENDSDSYSFKIGFRATKVTIDRGWFRPEVLKRSAGMWRLTPPPPPGGKALTVSHGVPQNPQDPTDLAKINSAIFPAHPIAFVIVKDVTIEIKSDSTKASHMKNFLDDRSSAGGGVLCFSASHSSASQSSGESTYTGMTDDSVVIRIPGPQILGWFLEYVPRDESTPFAGNSTDASDIANIFRLSSSGTAVVDEDRR